MVVEGQVRIGVDVGGTNTDAVLMDGSAVVTSAKQPTTPDVETGIVAAIGSVLSSGRVAPAGISAVMIGTTQFANALVERARLDKVGIIRLASPSGEALPPLTAWPASLKEQIGSQVFLLPGGYEIDGREIASLDDERIRVAVRACRSGGVSSFAVSSVFAPMQPAMEERAAGIILDEYPEATVSLSSRVGRLGIVERENGLILNAALVSLAREVIESYSRALEALEIAAPLYISQNDGTLITGAEAARYPILSIGSGPTNSMRGAAFLTGVRDGIVMDVGGTTCDIGVLANGFPRESTVAVDIGGVRTNFRMPDVLSIGLGGGTRIRLRTAPESGEADIQVGPDSAGYRITEESCVFGGSTLTASDIAVALGHAHFGDAGALPALGDEVTAKVWRCLQQMLSEGVDRMKTTSGDATIIAVGGANFLVGEELTGASKVIRPPHAGIANAVGAAIAQVGAQVEQIVDYETIPREEALRQMRDDAADRVVAAGGAPGSVEIVDLDEVFMGYLPGRSAQVRIKAVGDLADIAPKRAAPDRDRVAGVHRAT